MISYGDSGKVLYGVLIIVFVIFGAVWLGLGEWVWRRKFGYYEWYKNEYWIVGICGALAIAFFVSWLFAYESGPFDELMSLQAKYSPNMSRYAANSQASASVARTGLVTNLAAETQANTDLRNKRLEYTYAPRRAQEQHEREKAANAASNIRH